ncbi:MAG TPA: FAD-binding protein, partial [Smithellaceae bacterium]|nr:FAD-binding protein [Smithellaceae bacterium]
PDVLPEGLQIQRREGEPDDFPVTCETKEATSCVSARTESASPLHDGPFGKAAKGKIKPVVVIGSGPAGLFAAYRLALDAFPVILLERGRPVEKRAADVRSFWERGLLHPESNVLFGEGGAGAFSDGKLTSRSKNPAAGWVRKVLVEMGAPEAILTDAKPHIGTDRLRQVILRLRQKLVQMGCDVRFESRVTDFVIRSGKMAAVAVNDRQEIETDCVILAIGQSADDTYRLLRERGVSMEPKPFAMGLRAEHPQELINAIQYGRWAGHPQLPPAEYFVTAALEEQDRSVYTFCMCPGGQVIGCSAFPGRVITNGMSNAARSAAFANSAVVVNVRADDFARAGDPLSGLAFRDFWEKKAFAAGGGNYRAPAQKLAEFVEGKFSGVVGRTSFLPGVRAVRLSEVLPDFVANALREGLRRINQKMPGFIFPEAHLIGVETRTSSPVRIRRGRDGQSENVRGLYPCGEGSGYAGGIISSALDGLKAAQSAAEAISGRR